MIIMKQRWTDCRNSRAEDSTQNKTHQVAWDLGQEAGTVRAWQVATGEYLQRLGNRRPIVGYDVLLWGHDYDDIAI